MNKAVIGTTGELETLLDLTRKVERERIKLILTAYAEQLAPLSVSAQEAVEVVIKSIDNW